VDTTNGILTTWNPNANDYVETMVVNNGHLYLGGYFGTIGGQTRSRCASYNLATGSLDSWNTSFGGLGLVTATVFAMDAYQNTIFLAGLFGTVGGSNRVNVAAVDATTGQTTSWDAKQTITISSGIPSANIQYMTVYSNTVFVGISAPSTIGGQYRTFAAALGVTTGNATSWDPKLNLMPITFSGNGNSIYLGGLFSGSLSTFRTNLAAIDLAANQVTSWSPRLVSGSTTPVATLAVGNGQLFVGGTFTNINGTTITNLASIDLDTGALNPWFPNPVGFVTSLATWNNRLFVGGSFNGIAGYAYSNFCEIDLDSRSVLNWDPAIRPFIQGMTVSDNTLYVGGIFSTVSGTPRRRVAAFDITYDAYNANYLTSWDAGITSGSSVYSIATAGNNVYLGGSFTVVQGNSRTNFVALDASSAAVLPLTAHADATIYKLAAVSNLVFIGGNFQAIGGLTRNYLAMLNTDANAITPWNPNVTYFVNANSLAILDNVLYAGGPSYLFGGTTTRGLAAFPLSLYGMPTILTNSMRPLANSGKQFRLNAPGVAQVTVQATTNLADPNWQPYQPVPLVSGYGVFTDTNTAGIPRRFYRISVP
jgi:hypothetical protein